MPAPVRPAPIRPAPPPIPPARIAQVAGVVLGAGDYDWDKGRSSDGVGGRVSNASMTDAQQASQRVAFEAAAIPAAQLDPATARAKLAVMIGTLSAWVAANPHSLEGESAAVAQFFRDLQTRRLARANAVALGRTLTPDEIEDAKYAPPPEFYAFSQAANEFLTMSDAYEGALQKAGVTLDPTTRGRFDDVRSGLRAYAARGKPPAAQQHRPSPG